MTEMSHAEVVPYAWIEALDQEWIFIGTDDCIAAFRRRDLPSRWCERFKAPAGNLILAREIDSRGSPGHTPLDLVNRLEWPLADEVCAIRPAKHHHATLAPVALRA